jgi:hypothetical protein
VVAVWWKILGLVWIRIMALNSNGYVSCLWMMRITSAKP